MNKRAGYADRRIKAEPYPNILRDIINNVYSIPSDINEHVPTILKYGQECDHITEMGVRWIVSTWVWLGCCPEKLISYDIINPEEWGASVDEVKKIANYYDIDFQFHCADVLKVDIEETDLLFIDTEHVYDQLKQELKLHSNKVKKYIVFHDTTNFEWNGEDGKEGTGIWPAIEEFLEENKNIWRLKERFTNCSGLTIIERIKK
jgi:hypothetical protein